MEISRPVVYIFLSFFKVLWHVLPNLFSIQFSSALNNTFTLTYHYSFNFNSVRFNSVRFSSIKLFFAEKTISKEFDIFSYVFLHSKIKGQITLINKKENVNLDNQ